MNALDGGEAADTGDDGVAEVVEPAAVGETTDVAILWVSPARVTEVRARNPALELRGCPALMRPGSLHGHGLE
ncbi:MAG: hypothetical protein ACYCZY_06095 [Lacisediminihabitans sp.]